VSSPDKVFKITPTPALDGLRGFAVLAVVMFHSKWNASGYFGVDIFFVLSGFLITCLLLEEWNSTQEVNFKHFYLRRGLRLLPALFALLIACFLYETFYRPFLPGPSISSRIFYALTYFGNWVWALDAPRNPLTSLSAVWSLAIEEQFYFIWPVILYFLLKNSTGWKRIAAFLGVGILAVMAHRYRLWQSGADVFRISIATDSHADPILIGCLLGIVVSNAPICYWRRFDTLAFWCGPVMLIGLGFMVTCFDVSTAVVLHLGYTIIAILTSGIILVAAVFPSSPVKRIFEHRLLVWVGKLSYGIYLWHGTTNNYLEHHFPTVPTIARVALGFSLAAISYYCLERPCLRLKERLPRRIVPSRQIRAAG
jgi:peptidoglycan/LPS O-acetylase OafA/YrhL